MKLTVREYLPADGRSCFREWLHGLDIRVRTRIQAKILRFEMGNLGDHKSVGGGVWKARVMFGPGYRIYFGKEGLSINLYLPGGDKSPQARDIRKARQLWSEHLEATQHGKTHRGLEPGTGR
jgi:putative addiction module killer protein